MRNNLSNPFSIFHPLFFILFLLCALCVFVVNSYADAKPTVDQIADKLSCFCGTCPHLVVTRCGCSMADKIKSEIRQKIDSGMSEPQIIQAFVAEYGETVLSAPPRHGFSLTAWALPFLGFILGGTVLFSFLKRQQNDRGDPSDSKASSQPSHNAEEDRYREQLRKEMESRK